MGLKSQSVVRGRKIKSKSGLSYPRKPISSKSNIQHMKNPTEWDKTRNAASMKPAGVGSGRIRCTGQGILVRIEASICYIEKEIHMVFTQSQYRDRLREVFIDTTFHPSQNTRVPSSTVKIEITPRSYSPTILEGAC